MTTRKDEPDKAPQEKAGEEKRVTFVPAVEFTGYPEPYRTNRKGTLFKAGVESIPVPPAFADLMREKGLVADKKTTTADVVK